LICSYDITDKTKPTIISNSTYNGASYTHQGWVLDPHNQTYLIMDDEFDEIRGRVPGAELTLGKATAAKPTSYIWDISSLEKPVNTGLFQSPVNGVDHNQYVYNSVTYQSNYGSGLRVVDLRSIPSDPSGKSVQEIGFFDIYPEDDAKGGTISFAGSWSSFAGFRSGYIYINSIERGGFVVKIRDQGARR
jgi:choice-of-anchor B domain-containing protein